MSNTYRVGLTSERAKSVVTRRERRTERQRKMTRRAFESSVVTSALSSAILASQAVREGDDQ